MTKWERIGAAFGTAIAKGIEASGIGDLVRAHYADQFGTCRICEKPLGGPSPEQVCEPCHASELLNRGLGGNNGGDA